MKEIAIEIKHYSFLGVCKEIFRLFFLFISFLSFGFNFWPILIELHEFCKIELWLFEELNFSYNNVLQGEDLTTFLSNLFTNSLSSTI